MSLSKSKEASSGVCLIKLIETQMFNIIKAERSNENKMCLYETGDYWTAFGHSAYQLKKIFPEYSIFVVNHPKFPDAVVGISVPEGRIKEYGRRHISRINKRDYMEFVVGAIDSLLYRNWHQKEVKSFNDKLAGGCIKMG